MSEPAPFNASVIVDAAGKPARQASDVCPRCGEGPDKRVASSGFGPPAHPVCCCGYEWFDEVFRG